MLKGAAETSEFLGKRAAAAAREWEGRRYNRSENDEKKKRKNSRRSTKVSGVEGRVGASSGAVSLLGVGPM